jgi:hypothetical protein
MRTGNPMDVMAQKAGMLPVRIANPLELKTGVIPDPHSRVHEPTPDQKRYTDVPMQMGMVTDVQYTDPSMLAPADTTPDGAIQRRYGVVQGFYEGLDRDAFEYKRRPRADVYGFDYMGQ